MRKDGVSNIETTGTITSDRPVTCLVQAVLDVGGLVPDLEAFGSIDSSNVGVTSGSYNEARREASSLPAAREDL